MSARSPIQALIATAAATTAAFLLLAACPLTTSFVRAEPAAAAGAEPAAPAGTEEDGKFTDGNKRFTVAIPEGWTTSPPSQPSMAVMIKSPAEGADDTFTENVNVVVVDLSSVPASEDTSLDTLVGQAVAGVKEQFKATVNGDIKHEKLDGEESRVADMTIEANGQTVKSQQTYAIKDKIFYVITYTSAPTTKAEMNEAAKSISESWKFLAKM